MTIVLLLLLPLVMLILWVLFVPVCVKLDTEIDLVEISQSGTLSIAYHARQSPPFSMRLFGMRMVIQRQARSETSTPPIKTVKKRSFKRSPATWYYFMRGVYRSIRLKRLTCAMDLDDVVLNAKLIPLLLILDRGPISVATNFENRNVLYIDLRVSVYRLMWAAFKFYTKK